MKKILIAVLIFLFFPVFAFAAVPRMIGGCQVDPITGNRYCHTSLASRYRTGRIDYSTNASYRDTSSFYRQQQVCPQNSRFERFPVNACVCLDGYEASRDKAACLKKTEVLPNEATRVLMKALSGQRLTLQEKSQKGAIIRWIQDVFATQ